MKAHWPIGVFGKKGEGLIERTAIAG